MYIKKKKSLFMVTLLETTNFFCSEKDKSQFIRHSNTWATNQQQSG